MSFALQNLEEVVDRHLQNYLSRPAAERTPGDYMALRTALARTAQEYARQVNEERRTQLRQQRKGVGR